tara:strand:+ start:3211 stop:3969 length:759 start_codon:yes stop_codon:yes gene_type:complete
MQNEFGSYLKKIRLNEQLTQNELAKKLGLARITVHYYEKGQRQPSSKVLQKLEETFPNYSSDVREEENTMDDRLVTNLLDQNENLKTEIRLLKHTNKTIEFQQMANESIGTHIWIYQAEMRRKGLRFERRLTDIGNGKDIFMNLLGYSEEESDLHLHDDWVPANPSIRFGYGSNKVKSVISVGTTKHLYNIFLKLPTLIKHIVQGSYKIDIPFKFLHKKGHTISAMGSFDIDIKTLTVSVSNYFFDENSNAV